MDKFTPIRDMDWLAQFDEDRENAAATLNQTVTMSERDAMIISLLGMQTSLLADIALSLRKLNNA